MKILLRCVFVVVMMFSLGCRAKLPTQKAEALQTRICACDAKDQACLGELVTEFVAFQRNYNGFAEPAAAKNHLKAAMKCAVEKDPSMADKVVQALKTSD